MIETGDCVEFKEETPGRFYVGNWVRKAMRRYQSELLQAGFFRALLADNEKSPDLAVIRRERERMSFILKLRSVFLPSTTSKPNAAPASAPAPVHATPAPVHATPAHPQAVSAAR